MTEILISLKKAHEQYQVAFHLVNVTYPLINEPKLLVGIIQNIFNSLNLIIETILIYETKEEFNKNFQSKLNRFRNECFNKYKFPKNTINLILELKDILELQKKSHTTFPRGDKFVLSSSDFQLKIINLVDIKRYLQDNHKILQHCNSIINH